MCLCGAAADISKLIQQTCALGDVDQVRYILEYQLFAWSQHLLWQLLLSQSRSTVGSHGGKERPHARSCVGHFSIQIQEWATCCCLGGADDQVHHVFSSIYLEKEQHGMHGQPVKT
jgi:hypothetical protein